MKFVSHFTIGINNDQSKIPGYITKVKKLVTTESTPGTLIRSILHFMF